MSTPMVALLAPATDALASGVFVRAAAFDLS